MTDPTMTPLAARLVKEARRDFARRGWFNALAVGGILTVLLGIVYAIPAGQVDAATQERDTAVGHSVTLAQAANVSADSQLALCLAGDATAKKMEQAGLCDLAQRLKQAIAAAAPTPTPGAQGKTGASGRGITATAIVNGHFQVTYSDGVTEDKGFIQGAKGESGRGITGSTITSGHLALLYSDGGVEDVGQVVGKDGKDGQNGTAGATGADGKPGRGIADMAQISGHLMVTYTDGSAVDLGPLPSGPQGKSGPPIVSWVQHYSDGTSTTCVQASDFDPEHPTYDCPPPTGGPTASLLTGSR